MSSLYYLSEWNLNTNRSQYGALKCKLSLKSMMFYKHLATILEASKFACTCTYRCSEISKTQNTCRKASQTFGKFVAWYFISVKGLQILSYLVSFQKAIFLLSYSTNLMRILSNIIVNTGTCRLLFVYWKTPNFSGKYNFLPFKKYTEH